MCSSTPKWVTPANQDSSSAAAANSGLIAAHNTPPAATELATQPVHGGVFLAELTDRPHAPAGSGSPVEQRSCHPAPQTTPPNTPDRDIPTDAYATQSSPTAHPKAHQPAAPAYGREHERSPHTHNSPSNPPLTRPSPSTPHSRPGQHQPPSPHTQRRRDPLTAPSKTSEEQPVDSATPSTEMSAASSVQAISNPSSTCFCEELAGSALTRGFAG